MVLMRLKWLAAGLLTAVAFAATAQAPEPTKPAKLPRLALVIGNGAYPGDALTNPANDAADMAALLKKSGFEIIQRQNVSLKEMHLALREFGDRLSRETLGLFYFAGHGVQVRGRNYLLPVDADIRREDEVAFNALDLQAVLEKMDSARNHTNLIILDACRNNPFATRFKLSNAGLAQIDAPPGTVVAFATAPGSVAADGSGRNGLYTKHLLAHFGIPGVRIEDAFKQVRVAVRAESKGLQTPWESTSLESELYLRAAPPTPPVPAQRSSTVRAKATSPGAAPVFEVGDQWHWQLTDNNKGTSRTYKRHVVAVTGDTVTLDNGTVTDLNGNTLRQMIGDKLRTYTPSTLYLIFPLTPGLEWSGKNVEQTGDDRFVDISLRIKVLGEEDFDAAFGKLRAVKVERLTDWTVRKSGETGTTRTVYWYSSQFKHSVRFEYRSTAKNGKVLVDEIRELLGFTHLDVVPAAKKTNATAAK